MKYFFVFVFLQLAIVAQPVLAQEQTNSIAGTIDGHDYAFVGKFQAHFRIQCEDFHRDNQIGGVDSFTIDVNDEGVQTIAIGSRVFSTPGFCGEFLASIYNSSIDFSDHLVRGVVGDKKFAFTLRDGGDLGEICSGWAGAQGVSTVANYQVGFDGSELTNRQGSGDFCGDLGRYVADCLGGGNSTPDRIKLDDQNRLFVRHDSEWRGVCDDNFDADEAEVACYQLRGHLESFNTGVSGPHSNFWLDDLSCTGAEASLFQCGHGGWGSHNCGSGEWVSLNCDYTNPPPPPPEPIDGNVQLDREDRLLVYYDDRWAGVCDDSFDQNEANVVCRQMGFGSGSYTAGVSGPSSDFWLDDLSCTGVETSIGECSHAGWGNHNCGSGEWITIQCDEDDPVPPPPPAREGVLKLNTNNQLLVYHDGRWGGVCDDNFDAVEAQIACRQIGFEYVSYATGQAGPNSDFWLDDLSCSGGEDFLAQCQHAGWGSHNCGSGEWVSLACDYTRPVPRPRPPVEGGVKIDTQGLLHIYHDGRWGGVCDDSFDREEAFVACSQLGGIVDDYATGQSGPNSNFLLDDLVCGGIEDSLAECSHSGWGTHNCGSGEWVRLSCQF